MTVPAPRLAAGFADPVHDAQRTFRALMAAMAEPARPVALPADLVPPAPLTPELAALALTLLDYETPVWLDAPLAAAPEVATFLRFHTGAPITADTAAARFALAADAAALPGFSAFAQGEPDYPERSTTVLVAVAAFTAAPFTFAGPGIAATRGFGAAPLPADFTPRMAQNRGAFPLGIDLVLCAPGAITGLPRTVRLLAEG